MKERIDIRKINDELTVIFSETEFVFDDKQFTVYYMGNRVMDGILLYNYDLFKIALKAHYLREPIEYIKDFRHQGDDVNSHDDVDIFVNTFHEDSFKFVQYDMALNKARVETVENAKKQVINKLKESYSEDV